MRATVVPSEKIDDIQAPLFGVVAQPAVVYSDKGQTFLTVMRAFGTGHETTHARHLACSRPAATVMTHSARAR